MNNKQHWESIYAQKAPDQFSWFQPYPRTSIEFIRLFELPLTANIIDIGGGDSMFADVLIKLGYQNIWVLDISAKSIERAKLRLGEKAANIHWIVSDVTQFEPPVSFDFWHDRAAFHFLTSEDAINRYVSIAEHAIHKDGYLVLGTFSENGPKKCSGLDIKQYSEASMSYRFELAFERIRCVNEDHVTPFHMVQHFLFCSFRKK